jgi:hypothetical protein
MEPADVLVEFSRLLDSYEISDEGVWQSLIGIVQAMLDESHWRPLEEEALTSLLFEGISLYGQTNWEPLVRVIAPVYLHAMEQVPVETRKELQAAIRQKIEASETSINALLPFLFLETEMGVVSTSAIDFAMVPKPPEDDPLGWPRRLVSDLEAGMGANKGAILGGLITLGDRRVNDLLREVKWLISDDEIGVAVRCISGMPAVATIEFWLGWAEELSEAGLDNTGLFGQVASGLAFLVQHMRVDSFADISRNFGYLHLEDNNVQSMVIHGQYSKLALAERYANRLYALEASESPPKLMSDVIRHLGMEPKAPLEDRYTMQ